MAISPAKVEHLTSSIIAVTGKCLSIWILNIKHVFTSISFAALIYSWCCAALTPRRCSLTHCPFVLHQVLQRSAYCISFSHFFPLSCYSFCFCLSLFAFLLFSLLSPLCCSLKIWAQQFCLCQVLGHRVTFARNLVHTERQSAFCLFA